MELREARVRVAFVLKSLSHDITFTIMLSIFNGITGFSKWRQTPPLRVCISFL